MLATPLAIKAAINKWTFTTHGDVSATPAVLGNIAYFPDWGGYLNAVNIKTGHFVWQVPISQYENPADIANVNSPLVSRTSPAIVDNTLYIGDQGTYYQDATTGTVTGAGAHLFAINANNGQFEWRTTVDTQPAAILTGSPVVYNGVIYQGVSSKEEGFAANSNYKCCIFRGNVTAINASNGRLLWKTYTVPAQPAGYSGGAVWGTTPAINPATNTVYIGVGNNYTVPSGVCTSNSDTNCSAPAPDDYVDSILALNMSTGAIEWATGSGQLDAWTVACFSGPGAGSCPPSPGLDADFGSAPNLIAYTDAEGNTHQILGAGQKDGTYWALDPNTGKVLWSATPGPAGTGGGIEWGSASDGKYIYVAEANTSGTSYTIAGPVGGSPSTTTAGSWAALDPATGKVVWQIAVPDGGWAEAAMSTANGVLYAGSMPFDAGGHMYAIDTSTGNVLWTFQAPGAVNAAPAIVNGVVYWGNGYGNFGPFFKSANTFYAFSLGGS